MCQLLFLKAFLLCTHLISYEGFIHFSQYTRLLTVHLGISTSTTEFATTFQKLSTLCQPLAISSNTTATLINLIQFGDNWVTKKAILKNVEVGKFERFKKGDKVQGCMADVRIVTSFNIRNIVSSNIPDFKAIPKLRDITAGVDICRNSDSSDDDSGSSRKTYSDSSTAISIDNTDNTSSNGDCSSSNSDSNHDFSNHNGNSSSRGSTVISIDGTADSRVAQGILALLCEVSG